MRTTKMVYWQEDECWLGYLEEFPDYWTQGETLEDLEEHLRDLHADLTRPGGSSSIEQCGAESDRLADCLEERLHIERVL